MAIVRGTRNNTRRAKNYIHNEAQRRLEETVPTFNDQVLNSLAVDSVFIEYYHIHDRIGRPCSCHRVELPEDAQFDDSGDTSLIVPSKDTRSTSITLQTDGLFGDSRAEHIYEDTGIDVSGQDYDPSIPDVLYAPIDKEGNVEYSDQLLQTNIECGICYRVGLQPGYTKHGVNRIVMTANDVVNLSGTTINKADTPNTIQRVDKNGYAEFEIFVPKYFTIASYSIRRNRDILKGETIKYNGHPLTDELLKRFAGTTIRVTVGAELFTHAVLEFGTDIEKVRGNISAENEALDYTLRDMIGNFTIVLPPTIHEVRKGDIIVIRDRRLVLRVTEKERKITAGIKQLEWIVQTRVVQPQETVKNIFKSFKIG